MFPVKDEYISDEYISIGKVVNTQGHRGAVRVLPLTDFPERFETMSVVQVYHLGRRRAFHIEETGRHKKFIIIKFKEVADMNAARELKGALLQVTRDELVPLPEDTYYIFDIIGLNVFTVEGRPLGRVRDVLSTGANDVYIVEKEDNKPLLVPALKQVVREIDLAGGRMVVDLPPGLMDE